MNNTSLTDWCVPAKHLKKAARFASGRPVCELVCESSPGQPRG